MLSLHIMMVMLLYADKVIPLNNTIIYSTMWYIYINGNTKYTHIGIRKLPIQLLLHNNLPLRPLIIT